MIKSLLKKSCFDDMDNSRISAKCTLHSLIEYDKTMFYCWRNLDKDQVWADLVIIAFDDDDDSSAEMYFIRSNEIANARKNNYLIDLSDIEPAYVGEQVIDALRKYIE